MNIIYRVACDQCDFSHDMHNPEDEDSATQDQLAFKARIVMMCHAVESPKCQTCHIERIEGRERVPLKNPPSQRTFSLRGGEADGEA